MQYVRVVGAFSAAIGLAAVASAQFGNHLDQHALEQLVVGGRPDVAYTTAFDGGDEFFHFFFTEVDGVGANVGEGKRFTRVPRADLAGPGEWMSHVPARPTGPNEQSCTACHIQPLDDGAGGIAHNVVRDPLRLGDPRKFIERQTPHLFGSGAVQRLAEEMTVELQAARDAAASQACVSGTNVTVPLTAKGVAFGSITAIPSGGVLCTCTFDTTAVQGVSSDLVVRPFGWKGDTASLREFQRNASHREIGMQPIELVGPGVDGDYDGVADEMTVGDLTGLVLYVSGQPRPLTRRELARWGAIDPLNAGELATIRRGQNRFTQVGCGACHAQQLTLDDPHFNEPSATAAYRDALLPDGQDPIAEGLDPAAPVGYDLTADLPDNVITDPVTGEVLAQLGNFRRDAQGRALVPLFGDLKRHDMGPGLAENIDEIGTGASMWLTENLWGCGSTAPYLHDGRAATLDEAIRQHGGEALPARNAFLALSQSERDDLIAFLNDMVITKLE